MNKLALGHHADDAIETLFLNLFYTGRLASMAPKVLAENEAINVIRPLILADEHDIAELAKSLQLPVTDCSNCPVRRNPQREKIKKWILQKNIENPYFTASVKKALMNVQPRHLWDNRLWNFNDDHAKS